MNTTINNALPTGQILVGDAHQQLRRLPERSIDTVITSPPYWLLRNYDTDGQIGAENSVQGWVDNLAAVAAELVRVLKPGGSLWLNLGDTYSRHRSHGAPPKSLVLGPERLLLRLVKDGWTVRNKVVWAKPNPMPASVRDRLTCTWEPLYLLARDRHYFFDLDAIRIPAQTKLASPVRSRSITKYRTEPGKRPAWSGPLAGNNSGLDAMKAGGRASHPLGKNPGDVWTIPTASYRGAHFATFPERLIERPLQATCPQRTCQACGVAWRRARQAKTLGRIAVAATLRKSCPCPDRSWRPGVVLDPFIGAGTTAVAAERLHRRWIGIDINNAYATQATQRITAARGGGHA